MDYSTSIEGKAKILSASPRQGVLSMFFKDSLTAFNGEKKAEIPGKGKLCAAISAELFKFLGEQGIATHFLGQTAEDTIEVRPLKMIPLEVVVRNVACGNLCKRLNLTSGKRLRFPLVHFHLKDDALGDPLLTSEEVLEMTTLTPLELAALRNQAISINWLLECIYRVVGLTLVDFKLEFGLDAEGKLRLGDELSPDTMRLWTANGEKLDKDRFREDIGDVLFGYGQILERTRRAFSQPLSTSPTPTKIVLNIMPRPNLLDPVGRTVLEALLGLGFTEVAAVRVGKTLDLQLTDYRVGLVEEMCNRLLVSPAAETYTYELAASE